MQLRSEGTGGLLIMEDQATSTHAHLPTQLAALRQRLGELKRSMLLKGLCISAITNTDMA